MNVKKLIKALAIAGLIAPGVALATDGYFAHGVGMKAKGMGGAGIALPQDSLAAGTNPAGMVMVGTRLDMGVDWFRPIRNSEIAGNGFGLNGSYDGNGSKNFYIPEFGYNRMISPDLSLGVSVFGNGGMNTTYNRSPFAAFGGSNPAGVDLIQIFVSPTIAFKIAPNHAIGLSLNLAHQRFSADGLQPFGGISSDSSKLTNNGDDSSNGWGVRIGWIGQISPNVTLGATYQSKTRMSKFDKYAGLFAEQGDFDIPQNYGIGIAVKATPQLTIAADVVQIDYSDIAAVGNPLIFPPGAGQLLGNNGGSGFGWRDMTVLKLGASYEYSKALTMRAGYNYGRQPIPSSQTFFNILAPGVMEHHLTLGATWNMSPTTEVTMAYMHAFNKRVNGSGSIPAGFGAGEANLRMYQDSLGIAFGMKL